jgi:hypothetical protein
MQQWLFSPAAASSSGALEMVHSIEVTRPDGNLLEGLNTGAAGIARQGGGHCARVAKLMVRAVFQRMRSKTSNKIKNKYGRNVSVKKSKSAKNNKWAKSVQEARKSMHLPKGEFILINGPTAKGKELYKRSHKIYNTRKPAPNLT